MQQFKFIGILLGVAVRTKKPLDLHLAPSMWRLLAGLSLTPEDIEDIDLLYMRSLRGIRDIDEDGVTEENFHEVREQHLQLLRSLPPASMYRHLLQSGDTAD